MQESKRVLSTLDQNMQHACLACKGVLNKSKSVEKMIQLAVGQRSETCIMPMPFKCLTQAISHNADLWFVQNGCTGAKQSMSSPYQKFF